MAGENNKRAAKKVRLLDSNNNVVEQYPRKAMPSRAALLPIVCVHTQEEAEPIILLIISAIREVHHRTQRELEQRSMMDLP